MKVLLLETIAEEAMDILKSAENIDVLEGYSPEMLDLALINNSVDAIITRGIGKVTVELMNKCPNLTVIARCGVGLDNIDIKSATSRNIKVVNAPGSNANTVAEHTIALILMLQRNLFIAVTDTKNGNWLARNTFKADELGGKTLGILGLGNIGNKVGKIAEALGMNVVYWSKTPKESTFEYLELNNLFKVADVISIHLPLNTNTENLISTQSLSIIKPTCIIVNTARGQIVDQKAILNALDTNKLGGYASDVPTTPVPLPKDPLLIHPKTLITAHISSLTATTYRNMCTTTVNNVLAILNDKNPSENCIFNLKDLKN